MNANELEEYKQELIAENESDMAAIDRLIARERNKSIASLNGASGNPMIRHRRSAAAIVKEALMQLSGKFTRVDVASSIAKRYPASPLPRRTVAVELWKLARDGELQTVKEGRGRIPAKYQKT